ncbi:hypothetical protein L486_03079 [Kwoniella mangroviensis CBS 10435]|uniref:Uncharacterized protein n=1 Tax=Kwoniella mangroviensis CBS 10435 TaxID=1331196 RepID=A0A1B9ISS1_9TREE|nr:hypothetical protein L486_03079 [Kwoniella mangroviensis CBS 10435]
MVRTVREPNSTTPHLLRVSTSSATSSRGSSGGSPSQPVFVKSKTAYLASSPKRNGSTAKKRAVLGEREENIMSPSQPSPMRSKSKPKSKSSLTPRPTDDHSLSALSRFVAQSPTNRLPTPYRHDPSPIGQSPNLTFISRPGSTPYGPRRSIPMQINNNDDTLLLNMRPPEMSFSSPGSGLTDESDVEDVRGGISGRVGLMTPATSQEVSVSYVIHAALMKANSVIDLQVGSPSKSLPIRHAVAAASIARNSISRLPTPPSSQSGSYPSALPPTPQAGPSRISRIRARPSPTPPRRIGAGLSEVLGLGHITTEWDTPLRLGEDVSPNPRRKKSPRLSQPGQTPTRGQPVPVQSGGVEVVRPIRERSNTSCASTSKSTTPATLRPKSKGIVKSRIPNLSPSQSQSQTSRRSSGGNRKSSGGSAKSTTTPAASRSTITKKVPSTAPVGRRKPTSPKTRTTPTSQNDRRASVPANSNTITPKPRGRRSVAQTPKDVALSGRRIGTLSRPIHGSPGDDPLLLKGEEGDDYDIGHNIRNGNGLSLSLNNGNKNDRQIPVSSPFTFRQNEDLTLLPMDSPGEGYLDFGTGPAWSDDGSDAEMGGIGEDTFIHMKSKKDASGKLLGSLGRLGESILEEEEEVDKTIESYSRDGRSYTPILPPRDKEQHQSVEESISSAVIRSRSSPAQQAADSNEESNMIEEAGDVTQEMDDDNWEISAEQIEPTDNNDDTITIQPQFPHDRSSSPVADAAEDLGDITQEMEGGDWDNTEEDIEFARDTEDKSSSHTPHAETAIVDDNHDMDQQSEKDFGHIEEHALRKEQDQNLNQVVQSTLHDEPSSADEGEEEEGNKIEDGCGETWEISENDITLPTLTTEQSFTPNVLDVAPVHEELGNVEDPHQQPGISNELLDNNIPSRTSSSDHVPSLGESEEFGDVTQDMDSLDWEVSEEGIQASQLDNQERARSRSVSPLFERRVQEGTSEITQRELTIETPVAHREEEVDQEEEFLEADARAHQLIEPLEEEMTLNLDAIKEIEQDVQGKLRSQAKRSAITADPIYLVDAVSVASANEEGNVKNRRESEPIDTEISRSNDRLQSPLIPAIQIPTEVTQPVENIKILQTSTPSPSPAPVLRSTTPVHSPPPTTNYEPPSLRSPPPPRSPFVLIHHRGDLTFTPRPEFSYSNYRSPSPLPPPTPVFSAQERGHAILEEADRALSRLSKLRSLSPFPAITKQEDPGVSHNPETIENARADASAEVLHRDMSVPAQTVSQDGDGNSHNVADDVAAPNATRGEFQDSLQEEEEEEEDQAAGDVTAEADNSAWNLSAEEYEVPLRDRSDGESEEENREKEEERAEETEDEDNSLAQENAQQSEEASPEPVEVPERIVLRLVERGMIKLEAESDSEDVVQDVPFESDIPPVVRQSSSSASRERPCTPSRGPSEIRARSTTRSPIAGPSTPSVYPALSTTQLNVDSTTPKTAPPPSVLQSANSTIQVEGVTSLERTLLHRVGTSKLSQQIVPSSRTTEEASSPVLQQQSSPPNLVNREEGEESVVIRKPRRSLHDELAAVSASVADDDHFDGEGDDSFKSVVEVSSLDPKAAARAAAILKLNHAYIEHGILPRSEEKDLAISTKSTSHSEREKRDLLHEAELEIVESHRRSRSRSRSMSMMRTEREMSIMSFMTEDYPVPGAFVKTPRPDSRKVISPMKRKRDLVSVHETIENEDDTQKKEERWGVKEWKRLEKVYRAEKETWIKEREIKKLPVTESPTASPIPSIPGGLVAWARRSTFGTPKEVHVKKWDIESVVDNFLDEEKKDGRNWDREMLVLRVQAIQRRISKLASSTASTSTSIDLQTPALKRIRPNVPTLPQTPMMTKSTKDAVEPPSTIKRMLGFVWGKSKAQNSSVRTSNESKISSSALNTTSSINKGKETEKDVLPTTQMREIRPAHPTSSRWTPVAPPPPPPRSTTASTSKTASTNFSKNTPAFSKPMSIPSSSLKYVSTTSSSITHSTSLPSLSITSSSSSSLSGSTRLYPPLNPPISQRSDAIARLFPDHTSTSGKMTASISEKNLKELGQIQKKRSGSVKSLVDSWEGKGIMGPSIKGKEKEK